MISVSLLTTCEQQTLSLMFDLQIVDEIQKISCSASLITWKKNNYYKIALVHVFD